jgi:hypothetical protein
VADTVLVHLVVQLTVSSVEAVTELCATWCVVLARVIWGRVKLGSYLFASALRTGGVMVHFLSLSCHLQKTHAWLTPLLRRYHLHVIIS